MRRDVAAQYFVVLRRMVVAFKEATRREYRGMMTWLERGCFAISPQCQQPGENINLPTQVKTWIWSFGRHHE